MLLLDSEVLYRHNSPLWVAILYIMLPFSSSASLQGVPHRIERLVAYTDVLFRDSSDPPTLTLAVLLTPFSKRFLLPHLKIPYETRFRTYSSGIYHIRFPPRKVLSAEQIFSYVNWIKKRNPGHFSTISYKCRPGLDCQTMRKGQL